MSLKFNADEVFQIAVQIENNAAAFYRRAAEMHSEKQNKEFFEELAKMEQNHARTFSGIQDSFGSNQPDPGYFDPHGETGMYLKAMAEGHGGEGSLSDPSTLSGDEPLEQVLQIALKLEKKSILYYTGLRDLVPEELGKDRVDLIIGEERKHVAMISAALSDFSD